MAFYRLVYKKLFITKIKQEKHRHTLIKKSKSKDSNVKSPLSRDSCTLWYFSTFSLFLILQKVLSENFDKNFSMYQAIQIPWELLQHLWLSWLIIFCNLSTYSIDMILIEIFFKLWFLWKSGKPALNASRFQILLIDHQKWF